jgi:copper chaperone CopZ
MSDAKLEMQVEGMSCQGCVRTIQRKLSSQPGVKQAHVNLAAARAVVEYDDALTTPDALLAAVEQIGYHALPA